MHHRRTTVQLDGTPGSVLEWSPDAPAQTVVLLHGGGADNAQLSWGEVGAELANGGYRVIAPDHPGYGMTPAPSEPLGQEGLVAYVGELVDALGLDEYVIGGLSMGGGMTLGHLLQRPGRARGAMLLASYGLTPRLTDGPFSAATHWLNWVLLRTGVLGAATRAYARNPKAMAASLRSLVRDPERLTPELVDAVVAEAAHGHGLATFAHWQRSELLPGRLRTDYTDRLHAIETPTLILHGTRDAGVPVARAEAAARFIPDARLVTVPGAGHWVQRDRPDVVIPAMLEFLGGLG